MDWVSFFNSIYADRIGRAMTFRKAVLSAGKASYPADREITVGVDYRAAGLDIRRGILYPADRVLVQIWLRDWFSRNTDGATNAELAQMVSDLRGQVIEGDQELYSRLLLDGRTLKYDSHQVEHRPDGVPFAVVVTLQAA